uniref:Protein OSCP1 n=1 Tax=Strigamia maritima TaxID=126957 RepID=T1JL15_STRMM
MSQRTFPMLFLNLGGEMVYILDQRLTAQNIPDDKARKVLNDIVSTMLNKRFMEELFKPQQLYSKRALRSVFDKLAHTSIMRLNTASMDKLYDLMTMAVKYQVYMAAQASDLLLITLNHLDSMRAFVSEPSIHQQVFDVYVMLIKTYNTLSLGSFELIRQTLLAFFEDTHVRVSIFLRDKIQNPNGRFTMPIKAVLPFDWEIPGKITCFDADGKRISIKEFETIGEYSCQTAKGSLEYTGGRQIQLGTNMYMYTKAVDTKSEVVTPTSMSSVSALGDEKYAKDELNFLADLLGSVCKNEKHEFRLNLFNIDKDDEPHDPAVEEPPKNPLRNVINIDASLSQTNVTLAKIIGEMTLAETEETEEDDLLDLMDFAAKSN